jgi:hypothetical protein
MFGIACKYTVYSEVVLLSRPVRSNIAKGVVVATGHGVQINQCDIM